MDRIERSVVLALGIGAIITIIVMGSQLRRAEDRRQQLDEFCQYVALSLHEDALDLADPKHQEFAADRFYSEMSGHTYREIMLCSAHAPNLSEHDRCYLAHDYPCLATMADDAVRAIRER